MLPCSTPGHLYSINVESINSGIPYADSFSVFTHYCMIGTSETESTLEVYGEIKYKKNVWGLVKSKYKKLKFIMKCFLHLLQCKSSFHTNIRNASASSFDYIFPV